MRLWVMRRGHIANVSNGLPDPLLPETIIDAITEAITVPEWLRTVIRLDPPLVIAA